MPEDENLFLLPEVQDISYKLLAEDRIKELKEKCELLVEQSRALRQDRQLLLDDFLAMMRERKALQIDLEQIIRKLRRRQADLQVWEVELKRYLKDTPPTLINNILHSIIRSNEYSSKEVLAMWTYLGSEQRGY